MKRRYPSPTVVLAVTALLACVAQAAAAWAEAPRLAYVRSARVNDATAGSGLNSSFLSDRYRAGMEILLGDFSSQPSNFRSISSGFYSATDPAFNPDASRLVFSGQMERGAPFQVWEYRADEGPRVLFSSDHDCLQPVFMPGGRLVFASNMAGEYEEHGNSLSLSLYQWFPEEERIVRITHNPSSDFDPEVLPDGRILYSSWQHVGNHFWPAGMTSLLIVNSDGTGIFPLTGNHRAPWMKRSAHWWYEDEIAFLTAPNAHLAAGTVQITRLNDPFAEYEGMPALAERIVADLEALPDGRMLVSTAFTHDDLGLYLVEGDELTKIVDDPDFDEFAPAVGLSRPMPDIRFSTVVEDTPHGFLLILNIYDTDRHHQHALEPGDIEYVRVLEGLPATDARHDARSFRPRETDPREPWLAPYGSSGIVPTRILGEVPPATDGSVYLKVPADTPLRLQLVDDEGFARVDERAWFWVRPNERRVCIGCHEDRELSPHNQAALAAGRRPTDLNDPKRWEEVSFVEDVQPVLDNNCAFSGCHATPRPAAGLNLAAEFSAELADSSSVPPYLPSYSSLMMRQEGKPSDVGGRIVHPGDARSSPLLWMLYGRRLGPQYPAAPFDRPMASAHPGPMLPESELAIFRRWVDLGAIYSTRPSNSVEVGTTAGVVPLKEGQP